MVKRVKNADFYAISLWCWPHQSLCSWPPLVPNSQVILGMQEQVLEGKEATPDGNT